MEKRIVNKPVLLPWKAKRKGTAELVWFEIVDCEGYAVMNTDSEVNADEHLLFRDVAFMLCNANGSDTIIVDDREIKIEWAQ